MLILVSKIYPTFENPDKLLIEKNSEGRELIFVQTGECIFTLRDEMLKKQKRKDKDRKKKKYCGKEEDEGVEKKEQILRAGRYFGEISLTYDCACTSNVFAKKYCTIGHLKKEDYQEILKVVP